MRDFYREMQRTDRESVTMYAERRVRPRGTGAMPRTMLKFGTPTPPMISNSSGVPVLQYIRGDAGRMLDERL